MKTQGIGCEFSFPQLIVVPLSCHEVDGVRKEKERLTAAQGLEYTTQRSKVWSLGNTLGSSY